jgi:hypothetical protein
MAFGPVTTSFPARFAAVMCASSKSASHASIPALCSRGSLLLSNQNIAQTFNLNDAEMKAALE